MISIPLAICSCTHVPFFASGYDNEIQREADISQVYYFKESGKLYSKEYMPTNDLVELVGPSQELTGCTTQVICDDNKTTVKLASQQNSAHEEPFTQSQYYKYFSEPKTCNETFSVDTNCSTPWGAVVGKKEEFYLTDYAMFPVVIARIHGSWWNDLYLVGWLLLLLFLVPFAARRFSERKVTKGFLLAAAVTYVAFFIDKLVATIGNTPGSAAAWTITFIELLPLLLIYRLYRVPGEVVASIAILSAVLLFFAAGVGFVIGNVFLLVGATMTLLTELGVI